MSIARRLAAVGLALLATPLAAQTAPLPAPTPVPAATPTPTLPQVAITTSVGRIVVAVDTVHAPITGGNFLRYVDQKRLDGTRFYRVVKVADHFGFVQFGTSGDPKRTLPPIKHEPTTVTGIKHTDGTLSIGRFAPGSATGDFTIMVGDQPSMDADPSKPGDNLGYAAWGHVISGMDVVMKIFDTAVSPTATERGAFQGQVPAAPITVLNARRGTG